MVEHLSPETFIDLLDGTLAESSLPHLRTCDRCVSRLEELRATASTVDVDVPEPSPLFWDHLSARVRDAVAEEGPMAAAPVWWRHLRSWRVVSVASAAVAMLAVVVGLQLPRVGRTVSGPAVSAPSASSLQGAADAGPAPLVAAEPLAADDEPLGFVADLASELDWEGASAAGFAVRDSADRVLNEMTDSERVELQRLLSEALGRTGA